MLLWPMDLKTIQLVFHIFFWQLTITPWKILGLVICGFRIFFGCEWCICVFQNDNRCTIMATLETTDYCRQKKFDPEDPRCARVMLSGKVVPVYFSNIRNFGIEFFSIDRVLLMDNFFKGKWYGRIYTR